jgi:hypothetical protein
VGFTPERTEHIQAPLGRRDAGDQSEHVLVSLDTYRDRRTAYSFGVTASGVRLDRFHGEDREDGADAGFDPVWEARTVQTATGWTAELWIPFSQLRFNDAPSQVWGLNVSRFTPTLNEQDYWCRFPHCHRVASRFGDLVGLDDLRSARRVELLPYVAGSTGFNGAANLSDPFLIPARWEAEPLDLRAGIASSLTLTVALNPDSAGRSGSGGSEPDRVRDDLPEKRPSSSKAPH